ncbi:Diphthamide biosynthesis protein 2 [Borealophlyctis nickersoniae]|nr:Diphthamide biosynthesis protein 2 [Borealophlyctis nickersoniae]
MTGPTTFADDGRSVLERSLELHADPILSESSSSLLVEYDIERTAQYISKGGYSKVALQFPDELLPDSAEVYFTLQERTTAELFILADTTFGSCCVDEVAAEHVNADLVVHYGRACLSPTSRLPVLYVFRKGHVDAKQCSPKFEEFFAGDRSQPIILMYDVNYSHVADTLLKELEELGYTGLIPSYIDMDYTAHAAADVAANSSVDCAESCCSDAADGRACEAGSCCAGNQRPDMRSRFMLCWKVNVTAGYASVLERSAAAGRASIYDSIEMATFGLQHFLHRTGVSHLDEHFVNAQQVQGESWVYFKLSIMSRPDRKSLQVFRYDPATGESREETPKVNRLLMRRYYMLQRAKDADVIGIVVGTLGVVSYLSVIEHLKRLIRTAGKKPYLLAVGKPNPAKLGNFLEIDCFVLVACPENSLLDSREFLRPIVTPFELELAIVKGLEWDGSYETDLSILAPRLEAEANAGGRTTNYANEAPQDSDDDEPHFSLITGGYKQSRRYVSVGDPGSSSTADEGLESGLGQLALRNQESSVSQFVSSSAASQFLNEKRLFRGLERRIGDTEVMKAEEGRHGVARGYSHEEGKGEQQGDR